MWDQAKNPSTSPEKKLKPLYCSGEGRKRESGISMWNKDVEGAWRMDINVRFVENTEDYEGVCGVQSDLNVDGEGDSSESESCTNLSDGEESDSESSTD